MDMRLWRIHTLRPFFFRPSLPLNRSATLASSNAPTQASPPNTLYAVQYLVQSCGLSSDEALKASQCFPGLIKSSNKPDAVLCFLRETGISELDIRTAVSRDARILHSHVKKNWKPNIAKLQELRFSIEDISGPKWNSTRHYERCTSRPDATPAKRYDSPFGQLVDICIINIYDEGDCIPPHINHNDFLPPFCTVSFLYDARILFGRNLKVFGPDKFSGSTAISLPCGSVIVLSGNGADEAKHCVPAVRSQRISITFRKMDPEKLPYQHRSVIVLSGNGAEEAKHCVPAVRSQRISITFRKMDPEKLPYQHRSDPDFNFI